jgi:hypothetical protein
MCVNGSAAAGRSLELRTFTPRKRPTTGYALFGEPLRSKHTPRQPGADRMTSLVNWDHAAAAVPVCHVLET